MMRLSLALSLLLLAMSPTLAQPAAQPAPAQRAVSDSRPTDTVAMSSADAVDPVAASDTSALPGDPRVRAVLDELGYEYEVDADGDFRAVFEFEGEKRSQIVYVNSQTSQYDSLELREVWSPAIESKGPFAPKVANKLLAASFDAPIGAWQVLKQANGTYLAVFAVKLAADADAYLMRMAMKAVLSHADEMEKELSKKDTY